MCQMCDCQNQRDSRRSHVLILVVMFILAGVLALLITRLNSLINNAYDLSQQNHVVACHIDREVSGLQILQCKDVPTKSLNQGGK